MTLETILESIQNWDNARKSETGKQLLDLFDAGTGFDFIVPKLSAEKPLTVNESVTNVYHAYPGLVENQLYYFVIKSTRDTKEQYNSKEGILSFISVCPLVNTPFPVSYAQEPIPENEATALVNNWNLYKEIWMLEQKQSEVGLYQGLVIPNDDVVFNQKYTAFFALNNSESLTFTADLVLYDQNVPLDVLATYSDLVRPIPPFKPIGTYAKENFFLLNLALD